MGDFDQDGIPDGVDKRPNIFDKTPANGGNRIVGGKPVTDSYSGGYGTSQYNAQQGILPIQFLDIVGIDPVDAKQWFTFASTNPAYKNAYNSFKSNVGRLGLPTDKKTLQSIWNKAVDWTQTTGTNNGDPFNYLESLDPEDFRKEGAQGPVYGKSYNKTTTTTKYSGSSAAQQISDEMERRLGRRATQEEIDMYTQGLNAAAKKEPSVSEGVTDAQKPTKEFPRGKSISTGTQSTGFDPTMFARNFAMSRPDYAESFAANTFLGLVEKLLRDPNAIGEVVSDGR